MLDWSVEQNSYPVAIKVPGGELISDGKTVTKDFGKLNTYEVIQKGSKVAVIGLGAFYSLGEKAAELIAEDVYKRQDQVGLSQTLALTFNQSCFLLKFTEQFDSLLFSAVQSHLRFVDCKNDIHSTVFIYPTTVSYTHLDVYKRQ